VAEKLTEIVERIGVGEASKRKIIVVESDGTPSVCDLAYLVSRTMKDRTYLDYKMLLLPNGLGSLPGGMFHSAAQGEGAETMDVADVSPAAKRTRFLFNGEEGVSRLPRGSVDGLPPASSSRAELAEYASDNGYKAALRIEHPEYENLCLVYFGARLSMNRSASRNVALGDHQASVAARARTLAGRVRLPAMEETYERAGRIHDSGKGREVWQRAMGGTVDRPLAKTVAPVNPRLIDGYRHELGSVVDAVKGPEGLSDDLLLHLIASHHAGGRPYFETRQYDRQNLARSARECPEIARRFARLQAKYGVWGLAYLEAVFKCADGMVSAEEGEPASA
jgi:CRISPR-associated helicase Cas3